MRLPVCFDRSCGLALPIAHGVDMCVCGDDVRWCMCVSVCVCASRAGGGVDRACTSLQSVPVRDILRVIVAIMRSLQ